MRFQWSSSIPWELSYSGYVKLKLYSTCRRSHVYYCGHLSTLYINQHIPWDILTRFKWQGPSLWSRKDRLFVMLLWISMLLRQLFTTCGIAKMRQASSQGGLDKVVDAWQPHRMTDIWPSVHWGIIQQLPENCNKMSHGVWPKSKEQVKRSVLTTQTTCLSALINA